MTTTEWFISAGQLHRFERNTMFFSVHFAPRGIFITRVRTHIADYTTIRFLITFIVIRILHYGDFISLTIWVFFGLRMATTIFE